MVSKAQDQIHFNSTLAEKLGQEDKTRGQHVNTVIGLPVAWLVYFGTAWCINNYFNYL